jgi:DNA-binding transcriptional ArsR family regulator
MGLRRVPSFKWSDDLQNVAFDWWMIVAQEVFDTEFCAERLKALSDPHRLKIVNALRYGELTVGDIAELLEAEVVTVSHHLKIMKYANLVEVRREGRFMYYRLHEDLQCTKGKGTRFLDLGCCRLEVPDRK